MHARGKVKAKFGRNRQRFALGYGIFSLRREKWGWKVEYSTYEGKYLLWKGEYSTRKLEELAWKAKKWVSDVEYAAYGDENGAGEARI